MSHSCFNSHILHVLRFQSSSNFSILIAISKSHFKSTFLLLIFSLLILDYYNTKSVRFIVLFSFNILHCNLSSMIFSYFKYSYIFPVFTNSFFYTSSFTMYRNNSLTPIFEVCTSLLNTITLFYIYVQISSLLYLVLVYNLHIKFLFLQIFLFIL